LQDDGTGEQNMAKDVNGEYTFEPDYQKWGVNNTGYSYGCPGVWIAQTVMQEVRASGQGGLIPTPFHSVCMQVVDVLLASIEATEAASIPHSPHTRTFSTHTQF
jgi:hypothetical protein